MPLHGAWGTCCAFSPSTTALASLRTASLKWTVPTTSTRPCCSACSACIDISLFVTSCIPCGEQVRVACMGTSRCTCKGQKGLVVLLQGARVKMPAPQAHGWGWAPACRRCRSWQGQRARSAAHCGCSSRPPSGCGACLRPLPASSWVGEGRADTVLLQATGPASAWTSCRTEKPTCAHGGQACREQGAHASLPGEAPGRQVRGHTHVTCLGGGEGEALLRASRAPALLECCGAMLLLPPTAQSASPRTLSSLMLRR